MAIDPRTRTGEVKGYYIGPRANLRGAKLDHAILTGANLAGADLTGADLSFAHLQEADLTGAILEEANLYMARLDKADLTEANLKDAVLWNTHLNEATLTKANLTGADLHWAELKGADLTGAILRKALFYDTWLGGAVLIDVDFRESEFKTWHTRDAASAILRDEAPVIRDEAPLIQDDIDLEFYRGDEESHRTSNPYGDGPKQEVYPNTLAGPVIRCNFDGACIDNWHITGAFLWDCTFKNTFFNGTGIGNSIFLSCNFKQAHFNGENNARYGGTPVPGDISHSRFIGCGLDIQMNKYMLRECVFKNNSGDIYADRCSLSASRFIGCRLSRSYFQNTPMLYNCSFTECDLESAMLVFTKEFTHDTKDAHAKMVVGNLAAFKNMPSSWKDYQNLSVNFLFCNLKKASFLGVEAIDLDLFGSDLSYSKFSDTYIKGVRLAGAQFTKATFIDVEIDGLNMQSDLHGGEGGGHEFANLSRKLFFSHKDFQELLKDNSGLSYLTKLKSNVKKGILAIDSNEIKKSKEKFEEKLSDPERPAESYTLQDKAKLEATRLFPEIFERFDEQAEALRSVQSKAINGWLKTPAGELRGDYGLCVELSKKNKKRKPILVDFTGANLDGIKLSNLEITVGLCLDKCSMKKAELASSNIDGSSFVDTDLESAEIISSTFNNASFDGANLSDLTMVGCLIGYSTFDGADFKGAKLLGDTFHECDLSKAKNINGNALSRCYFHESTKTPPNFVKRNYFSLRGLKIGPGIDLTGADLHGANLIGVDLSNSILTDADLQGADLSYARFLETNLEGANLDRAKLDGSKIIKSNFSNAKLRKAKIRGSDNEATGIFSSNLSHADMSGAKLKNLKVAGSDFSHAHITGASLDLINVKDSDLSHLDAQKIKAKAIDFQGLDLSDADFSGSNIDGFFSTNDLKNTSFDRTTLGGPISKDEDPADEDEDISRRAERKITFFGRNKFDKTKFTDATLNKPVFSNTKSLGTADFSGAKIIHPRFDQEADARKASFNNTTFILNDDVDEKGEHTYSTSRFMPTSLMPDSLRQSLRADIEKHDKIRKKIIESDPRYLGTRTGLWIHMTNEPETSYKGELCVSPYEEGEPIFEERGAYGLIFKGTAPLFNMDVWSSKDRYSRLVPGTTPPSWKETFKEGFLDADICSLERLNILEGFERPGIIKKFKKAGIPIYIVEGSEKAKRKLSHARPSPKIRDKALQEIRPRDESGRVANPGCCVCGQPSSLMSGSGHLFCEDCF